jgi:aminoglycoside 2'-N-acetyltransferase I
VEPAVLRAARALLDDVVAGEMTGADWEHALGGIHAMAWEGDGVIGHASVIQPRLWLGGRALRTGYVEGVGVRADHRGRGVGAALMEPLEPVIRNAYASGPGCVTFYAHSANYVTHPARSRAATRP